MGPDYIKVKQKLPQLVFIWTGFADGQLSRQAPNQVTLINLAFEYSKRGNNDNLLKENTIQVFIRLFTQRYLVHQKEI